MLKKKINFKRVERKIIGDRVNKLRLEAKNIETGMINRTLGGKDVKKKKFKRYSREYEKQKQRRGRGTTPNLTDTGAMLQAISSRKITNGLRFYFSTSFDKKKAAWNSKLRNFFGMDKDQVRYIKKQLKKL